MLMMMLVVIIEMVMVVELMVSHDGCGSGRIGVLET